MKKEKQKNRSIYLWKLILIVFLSILISFKVIEYFFMTEKTTVNFTGGTYNTPKAASEINTEENNYYEELVETKSVVEINSATYDTGGVIIVYNNTDQESVKVSDVVTYDTGVGDEAFTWFAAVRAKKADETYKKFEVTEVINVYKNNTSGDSNNRVKKDDYLISKDEIIIYIQDKLLTDNKTPNIDIGNIIKIDFDYKNAGTGYQENAYGNINVCKIKLNLNINSNYIKSEFDIFGINILQYNVNGPILFYNPSENSEEISIKDIESFENRTDASSFTWFAGIIAKKVDGENGKFEITDVLNVGTSTFEVKIPKDGIALFFHDVLLNSKFVPSEYRDTTCRTIKFASIGDYIYLDFFYKYKNIKAALLENSESPFGKAIITINENNKKPEKNNGLKPLETKDLKPNEILVKQQTNNIIINLFDYNDNINEKYLEQKNAGKANYPFFSSGGMYGGASGLNFPIQKDWNADRSNTTDNLKTDITNNITGGINVFTEGNNVVNRAIRNVIEKKLLNGYPVLNTGESLGYLFGEEENNVESYNGLDGLLIYDKTKDEYRFDSRENVAQYNNEIKNISLYNAQLTPNYMYLPYGQFMPFNDINTATQVSTIDRTYYETLIKSCSYKDWIYKDTKYNGLFSILGTNITNSLSNIEEKYLSKSYKDSLYNIDFDDIKDYHFGMNMEFKFIASGNETLKNGDDVIYKFEGDDDVLIYIDDILFLELAGMHKTIGGEINFTKGEVNYLASGTDGYANPNSDSTETFSEIIQNAGTESDINLVNGTFKKNTIHTLKFYYVERGSNASVCSMRFNVNILSEDTVIRGQKKWKYIDTENVVANDRPEKIIVELYRRTSDQPEGTEEKINEQEISALTDWKYEFDKDSNGSLLRTRPYLLGNEQSEASVYIYTVKEKYVNSSDEENYSNKYVTEYVENDEESTSNEKVIDIVNNYICKDINVKKVWDDNNDVSERPETIEVELSAQIDNKDVTDEIISAEERKQILNQDNEWNYTWHLPKYKINNDGTKQRITYKVKENLSELQNKKYYQLENIEEIEKEDSLELIITNFKYREIQVTKKDEKDGTVLGGAKFKLQKMKQQEDGRWEEDTNSEPQYGTTNEITGQISFSNIEMGKYKLTEEEAPDGYNRNKEPREIEVLEKSNLIIEIEYTNKKGFILPFTGGNGITSYIIYGGILAIISLIILNRKNKIKTQRRHARIENSIHNRKI